MSGNEPASMVCKISGNNKRDLSFVWRLISFVMYGPWEDHLNRHETAFYQLVVPHLKDTSFRYPKVYFAGESDQMRKKLFLQNCTGLVADQLNLLYDKIFSC